MTSRDLGPFRIVRRIAIGGMAEVFLATARDGSPVVLKRALPELSSDASYREAIEHEASITERLRHPHLVRTFGVTHAPEGLSLVLEYVEGTTLDVLLDGLHRSGRRLTIGTAIRVAVDLLDALECAHSATDSNGKALGLVHRDVGPCNLLVSKKGTVKLADFGIARSHAPRTRTRTGTVKGTLRYLAPEQATSSTIDPRTDVYAVGLVLFELLTGEAYLRGDSDLELLRAAENPATRKLPPELGVDPAVGRALSAALSRFPEERPSSAAALRKKLLPFAADEETASTELAGLVDEFAPGAADATLAAPRSPGRARFARGVIVLLALAFPLFVFVAIRSRDRARAPEASSSRAASVVIEAAPADAPAAPPDVVQRSVEAQPTTENPIVAPIPNATRAQRSRPSEPPPSGLEPIREVPPVVDPAASPTRRATPAITRESVRAKLARADAAIRAARARGADVEGSSGLSSSALEAYAEGRYDDADRLLDRILASVSTPPSGTAE